MRVPVILPSRATVAVCVLLATFLLNAPASGANAALRFDGIYYRTDRDAVTQHFRFYPDGIVISVATPVEKTPPKIAAWFHRDWPMLAKGRYSVQHRSVRFDLKSDIPGQIPDEFRKKVPSTLHYAGTISPEFLTLRRSGEAADRKYQFVKVRFAK